MVQGLANFEIEDGPPSVYLDNNASTPLLAPVRDAMVDALDRLYGNPSGQHRLAQAARQAVEQAKQATARYLNASASEISFTCSASASIEQAVGNALRAGVRKLVIGATDHAAVVRASEECSRFGAEKVVIPVDRSGQLSVEALAAQISDAQTYVCTGAVNNETGGITDLQTLGAICRRAGAGLHVDASQAVGRIALDVARIDCDSMTLSPHKFHGPKGVGVLYAAPVQGPICRDPKRGERRTSVESLGPGLRWKQLEIGSRSLHESRAFGTLWKPPSWQASRTLKSMLPRRRASPTHPASTVLSAMLRT
jgi:cysteine desulfurase